MAKRRKTYGRNLGGIDDREKERARERANRQGFGPDECRVVVAFILTIFGGIGGLDAWVYWWVKSGLGHHQQTELVVASAWPRRSTSGKGGTRLFKNPEYPGDYLEVEGKIGRRRVSADLVNVFKDYNLQKREQVFQWAAKHPVIPVFWNGATGSPLIQCRSTHIVESSFILRPHSRVWWGPLCYLIAIPLWVIACRRSGAPAPPYKLPWRD